jgi:DNA ligase-1
MAPPTKRQKLNNNGKSSPAKPRGLEYFFGKQRQGPVTTNNNEQQKPQTDNSVALTDEQLARKLQAQWDEEAAASVAKTNSEQARSVSLEDGVKEDVSVAAAGGEDRTVNLKPDSKGQLGSPSKEMDGIHNKGKEGNRMASKPKSTMSLQSGGSEEDMISHTIPFDESPLTFNPAKYIPDLQSYWMEQGGNASYALLTRCFVLVNSTQSRIKIVDTLVNLLRTIVEADPSSLLPTVCVSQLYKCYSFSQLTIYIFEFGAINHPIYLSFP